MNEQSFTIRLTETSQTIGLVAGDSLLQAGRRSGVEIAATCGGRGRCRSCRIKLVEGTPPVPTVADRSQLSQEEIREGYRLACQCLPGSDAVIAIAPPVNETSFQILVESGDGGHDADGLKCDSGVSKTHTHPPRPSMEANRTSEIDELLGGPDQAGDANYLLVTARRIPHLLDDLNNGVTVARYRDEVVSIEPGDTSSQTFGLAFDIGTTTVVGYLMNLNSGETVSTISGLNPQTVFGGDVMSRIALAAENSSNVQKLHTRIVTFLNELSRQICANAGVTIEHVYKVTIVGNTCMHHLVLGIDPACVGRAPYAPVIRQAYSCPAREAGLRLSHGTRLFMLPLVAGFVGSDTVGMILSTRLDSKPGICIAADIGTNAEVVLNGPGGLTACSSPAGPALEGGQIRDGMRAALGAIDKVSIDNDVYIHTIGEVPALGICGSGLIDAVAALLDAGIISSSGRLLLEPATLLPDLVAERLRAGTNGAPELVLVWAAHSANRTDIVLSQDDIRQFQLAKAAIMSGVVALIEQAGAAIEDISEFMLAGGFGNYLNIQSARRIGLIPDIPVDRIHYVANAAGRGAQLALISEDERARAEELADT
ncbi:MAG: DUF4445 domain-containing protein, partial [Rhodobacteraceae bacterium]|nr:DUF4445 domain-containing protein [Paracoccaceae bacterium]